MQLKHVLAASAATLVIGLATPAAAQITEGGNGSADGNLVVTDGLDLLSGNSLGNGNNRDNEVENYGNGSASRGGEVEDNGNNRDNEVENYGNGSASRGGEVEDNGNNRDNENYGAGSASRGGEIDNENYGAGSASRGGEIEDNGNNRDNEVENYGNGSASRGGEVVGNGDNRENGNTQAAIVATQVLVAVNSNSQLDEVADFDGEDDTESSVGYNSGDNSVEGSSFAAFAGILNQAWNTGLNANTQAATNIAAQGSVSFGDTTGGADGGNGGGGD
ncbi:hypothetical protein [Allosphingosinicella vermicomposti]|uniref:hypothetical protein n=1 Tax=Allosphingosinicella vermicomposti TaxID=614671 RepID=UPI00131A53D5|nr:hypothetical protein [Allosphingosinicella vermicomposti]